MFHGEVLGTVLAAIPDPSPGDRSGMACRTVQEYIPSYLLFQGLLSIIASEEDLAMKKFLLGFITGAFLLAGLIFFYWPGAILRVNIGRLLDKDIICLNSNESIEGWILSEDPGSVLLETEKGTFTLPSSNIKSIHKNRLSRYIRLLP